MGPAGVEAQVAWLVGEASFAAGGGEGEPDHGAAAGVRVAGAGFNAAQGKGESA